MVLNYIGEEPASGNHAGNKARRDVDAIFKRRGYAPLENIVETRFGSTVEKINYALRPSTWQKIFRLERVRDRIVLAQFPTYGNKLMRRALNELFDRNRMILLVHDLDALRNFGSTSSAEELERLNRSRVIIVHNHRMLTKLSTLGVSTPMISLELFDYLLDGDLPRQSVFERKIIFAGNLAKSTFLRSLGSIELDFELYGPGEPPPLDNVSYRGSFSPEEVPYRLDGGFGLIWDGDSIDTCAGSYGEYLRLNNPHKLSLYIAAGLPVVTWKQAAIAEFILAHGIGLTVESLRELPSELEQITANEYSTMLENVARIQSRVTTGFYTARALELTERRLNDVL